MPRPSNSDSPLCRAVVVAELTGSAAVDGRALCAPRRCTPRPAARTRWRSGDVGPVLRWFMRIARVGTAAWIAFVIAAGCGGAHPGNPDVGADAGQETGPDARAPVDAPEVGDSQITDSHVVIDATAEGAPQVGDSQVTDSHVASDATAEGSVPDGGQCMLSSDCALGSTCVPGFALPPVCSNNCTMGDGCESDADCADAGAAFVCNSWCACPNYGGDTGPGTQCIKGCGTAADCGPVATCTATHHCEALPCTTDADCGANYSCLMGACAATPCAKDSDCTASWFCVVAGPDTGVTVCSPALGVCMFVGVP
jgi:hypothetical protein